MGKTEQKIQYIVLILLTILFIVFTLYNFGFEIYTYYWHIRNPEPVVLSNLSVTIPDGLVGKINDNNELEVTYLRDPLETTIYLRQIDFEPSNYICDLSVGRIAKSLCKISGRECIKIRFNREDSESGYVENLYLPEEKAYISFQGKRGERHYLLKLVEGIKII